MERLWNVILEVGSNRETWERLEKLVRDHRSTVAAIMACTEIQTLKGMLRHAAQQALGGRTRYITYGGAAIPPRILRFFD